MVGENRLQLELGSCVNGGGDEEEEEGQQSERRESIARGDVAGRERRNKGSA